jgi:hypothetical protein
MMVILVAGASLLRRQAVLGPAATPPMITICFVGMDISPPVKLLVFCLICGKDSDHIFKTFYCQYSELRPGLEIITKKGTFWDHLNRLVVGWCFVFFQYRLTGYVFLLTKGGLANKFIAF